LKIKKSAKLFSPGNLRATNESAEYKKLIEFYMSNRYKIKPFIPVFPY
jgi:hypothetical protein